MTCRVPRGFYARLVPGRNTLYYGDNLGVLRRHIPDASVDLIYLDPPFNSNATYNAMFSEQDGSRSAAQVVAFEDTWHWDQAAVEAFEDVLGQGGDAAAILVALKGFLGTSDMMAYLSMMAPRLIELRRVLKTTGSIYLHCDPTASHYLKLLMDAVFGVENYRREIIWRSGWVSGFKTRTRNWVRNHDVILYYLRDHRQDWTFNKDLAYKPHAEGYVRRGGGENPRGVALDDVWDEVELYSPWIKSFSHEKLGYATQKPIALLERIISVSSTPDGVILDPFCGCGTTIAAAEQLGRPWIGIDITHLAINLIKHRLKLQGAENSTFTTVGEPMDMTGALELAATDPYQFQWWTLGLVGARPAEQKKGADKGIDGRLFFQDSEHQETKQVIFSVKAGHVGRAQIHELRGVIEREKAAIGVFLSMEAPTRPMREEAAEAGSYEGPWGQTYPRLQLLTVAELLDGRAVHMPDLGSMATNVTHKRAPRAKKAPPPDAHPSLL